MPKTPTTVGAWTGSSDTFPAFSVADPSPGRSRRGSATVLPDADQSQSSCRCEKKDSARAEPFLKKVDYVCILVTNYAFYIAAYIFWHSKRQYALDAYALAATGYASFMLPWMRVTIFRHTPALHFSINPVHKDILR